MSSFIDSLVSSIDIVGAIIVWLLSGIASKAFWASRDHSVKTPIWIVLISGVYGPAEFFIGWYMHRRTRS